MLIFLDIDGVMVPAKSWERPELLSDGFPAFSAKATRVLNSLISENTTIILTTSHKSKYSLEEWKKIFERRGVKVTNLKSLEANTNNLSRKDEVLNWFNANPIKERFIIIDDDKSLNALPLFIKNNLILTSPMVGLTENHLAEVKILLDKAFQSV